MRDIAAENTGLLHFKPHKLLAGSFLGHSKEGRGRKRKEALSLVTKVHVLHRGALL